MKRPNTLLLTQNNCPYASNIFTPSLRERAARAVNLHPDIVTPGNLNAHRAAAADCDAILTCWAFPWQLLTPENFPNLKVVFYSGGAVKGFAQPLKLMERRVAVVSARHANSVIVARYCLAQILLACKGYWLNAADCRDAALRAAHQVRSGGGLYRAPVALLGMGMVARELAALLAPFNLDLLAVDPYLSDADAQRLNVRKAGLAEAFRAARVVSNHLPNLDSLRGVINSDLLSSLQPNAVFINTGRGAQVSEPDLISTAQTRPDLTFLLDVTDPEPPAADSPLLTLPNVHLTSHIAGAMNGELPMLGEAIISELERYADGQPFLHAEDLTKLDQLG